MTRYWRDNAACTTATAGLFDPPAVEDNARQRIEQAINVCGGCPVSDVCFDEAVRDSDSGVRGGELLADGRIARLPGRPAQTSMFYADRRKRVYAIIDMHHKGMGSTEIARILEVSVKSVDNDLRRYVRRAAWTAGQEALIEAMRIEQAKIYGQPSSAFTTSSTPVHDEPKPRPATKVTDIRTIRNRKGAA